MPVADTVVPRVADTVVPVADTAVGGTSVGGTSVGGILEGMTDESPREVRPAEALRREVEAPRSGAGLWMPMMALASAAMLTIVSAVAVMTRPPRAVMVVPAAAPAAVHAEAKPRVLTDAERREIDRIILETRRALEEHDAWVREHHDIQETRMPCAAPVYRGDIDGRWQPFEECITDRRTRSSDTPSTKAP